MHKFTLRSASHTSISCLLCFVHILNPRCACTEVLYGLFVRVCVHVCACVCDVEVPSQV